MEKKVNQYVIELAMILKKNIEQEFGRPYESLKVKEKKEFLIKNMQTQIDKLQEEGGKKSKLIVNEQLGAYSLNTLERLLGNNPDGHKTSNAYLNVTALYLGYDSFEDFIIKTTKEGIINDTTTVHPWIPMQEGATFSLTPLGANDEKTAETLIFEGEEVKLTRRNLDAFNKTITSKTQAIIRKKDGEWYIINESKLKTTYIRIDKITKLRSGDIILIGNRQFKFER